MVELIDYLKSETKHGNYQLLPPRLLDLHPKFKEFNTNSIRLDNERYKYFADRIRLNNMKVIDIGANIGYFSFRLVTERNCKVTLYEPYLNHIKAIKGIQDLLDLNSSKINTKNEGVTLSSIDKLEEADLILFFNVLQHAGEDFDTNIVKSVDQWFDYAVEYLKKLKGKTNNMVFQMGYSWLGHKEDLCSKKDIINFTIKLLNASGWNIKNCGVVRNYSKPAYYDFNFLRYSLHPVLKSLKYYEYGIKQRLGFDLPNYRFIQRPIFICSK